MKADYQSPSDTTGTQRHIYKSSQTVTLETLFILLFNHLLILHLNILDLSNLVRILRT